MGCHLCTNYPLSTSIWVIINPRRGGARFLCLVVVSRGGPENLTFRGILASIMLDIAKAYHWLLYTFGWGRIHKTDLLNGL